MLYFSVETWRNQVKNPAAKTVPEMCAAKEKPADFKMFDFSKLSCDVEKDLENSNLKHSSVDSFFGMNERKGLQDTFIGF